MKNAGSLRIVWIVAATIAVFGAIGWPFVETRADNGPVGSDPRLPFAVMTGKLAYDANCAQCHGRNGAGTDKGPPFVHEVYNPGHHSDASFASAVAQGVRQHHWRFGDMPAQPQVTETQLHNIVRYVRALQVSKGIQSQPHKM